MNEYDFLSDLTEGMSGADITEVCQNAAKAAIRDNINAEEEWKKLQAPAGDGDVDMSSYVETVNMITRIHMEEALSKARKSVSQTNLSDFETFRKKMDPAYNKQVAGTTSRPKINWPVFTSQFNNAAVDDDDLYS
jgi:transitional endoplasmic reticulum ATPase